MKKITFLTSLILALAVLVCGCSITDKSKTPVQSEVQTAQEEADVIRLGCVPPDTLNPLITVHASVSDFLSLVYEGLFQTEPDQTATPVLASEIIASEDNTVYTVKLKEGIRFHNGKAFTSADVTATLDYIFVYGGKYAYIKDKILLYAAESDYSVKITLNSPVSDFANLLDFPILPSGLIDTDFAAQNSSFVPVGTGMYKYDSSSERKNIYLKANDKRHSSLPTPNIEIVDVEILADEETIISAFDAGSIDILTTSWKDGAEMNLTTPLYNTYYTLGNKYTFVGINTNCAAFDTEEERHLLSERIDAKALCDDIMLGHGSVAYSPVREDVYYNETVAQDDKSDDADEGKSDKDMTVKPDEAENDTAKKEAPDAEENKIIILYNSDSKTKERAALAIRHQLESYGYSCELSGSPFATYLEKVANCHYDLYIGEVNPDNSINLEFMFGTNRSMQNICTYYDTELDTLVSNISRMSGKENKTVAWENFEKYYKQKVFQIPLYFTKKEVFVNKKIEGKLKPNISFAFSGFEGLDVKEDK